MKRTGRVLALAAWALLHSASALAEGSADFDVGDTGGNLANDQAVNGATVVRVDIANGGNEKVCWTGAGTMQLQRPNGTNVGSAVASGNCVGAVSGTTGAYFADIGDQTVGGEWDIRVCVGGVGDAACLSTPSNEQLGRVWSSAWSFRQNTNFGSNYAVNGSVYAVVPGGAVGRDAVIEMQMRGVSGAYYVLRANSTGPIITSSGARFGRSVPTGGIYSVNAEYPLYLSPPAGALYNWTPPVVSNVVLTPSCGTGVVLGRAPGQISFTSNITGQYVVVCDVNKDSTYDFAGTADFSSFGAAAVGTNAISWDGRNNAGASAAEGSYNCIIRLNVGEFHYVAEDIETSYPGIRMYRLESNKTTRTPIRMFWDDRDAVLGSGTNTMVNGQASPSSPLADGLDPTAITNAAAAFYFTGGNRTQPNGNARAWHDFSGGGTGTGKGNDNYLDQFAAADTAISPAISISVISNGGDADTDGLGNARECDLGSLPQDNDTDNDGVNDGYEATTSGTSTDSDLDTILDILDTDDDGDSVLTSAERGAAENGDGNPADAANTDGVGARDYLDTDSDNDGVLDGVDIARTNPVSCRDVDTDNCDDCSVTGANSSGGSTSSDGLDTNTDGQCNLTDDDDDGDGVLDGSDSSPLVRTACADIDGDGCDDCSGNSGPQPSADGADNDNDGACNVGDPDDDNDGATDGSDSAPFNANVCRDLDADGCNDCVLTGANNSGGSTAGDGTDTDSDGLCDTGDSDRDNDGVPNAQDSAPFDRNVCRDADSDGCNDCLRGSDAPNNDGTDNDGDGKCDEPSDQDGDGINDATDLDDDGDGILDTQENTSGINPDGDNDSDGITNQFDADDRGDGVLNACAHTKSPRSCDAPSTLFDQDGDGTANHLDLDADADGSSDASESGHDAPDADDDGRVDGAVGTNGVANTVEDAVDSGVVAKAINTDDDDLPNFLDTDSDGDGVNDRDDDQPRNGMRCRDVDNDGCDDCTSGKDNVNDDGRDQDADGRCDPPSDRDEDGFADADDLDDDGDGILDAQESAPGSDPDRDGDGTPNQLDLDSDGDGIFDSEESGHEEADSNADGRVDGSVGANGVADAVESAADSGRVQAPVDTDGDGVPDFLDLDSDEDGVTDAAEAGDDRPSTAPRDSDEDGTPDYRDVDDDNDGIDTPDERSADGDDIDSDEDGEPDYLDIDDDDDGIPSSAERPLDGDSIDTDHDGTPNHLDEDDDGDGVPTQLERSKDERDIDTDDDGKPDHLDVDDDGDGIATADEAEDADDDGVPDRLEPAATGTLAGGALCSLRAGATNAANPSALLLLTLAGLWLARRRRAGKPRAGEARMKWLGLIGCFLLLASAARPAHAQIALEQFKPAPLARDGFGLSRPDVLKRGGWSTLLLLDYANDPLVYEAGADSSQPNERVVSQHLVGHVGAAFGVAKRVTLFATLPVHLMMKGEKELTVDAPKPEGAGLGDLALGGRIQLSGLDPETVFGSAIELIARVPTAELANRDQHYSGDAIGSYEPALIGEIRAGRFDVRLRAGVRLREKKNIGNLTLGHEWVGGLGMRVRVGSKLYLHAEVYGSTFMNEAFERTTTPIESLFGFKYQGQAWNAGVAAGPGLWGGYGSPDVRVVSMLGYAPLAKKPVDSDGDGLLDPADRCPKDPEDLDGFEDADGCPDLDNDKDGILDASDSCIDEPEDTDDFEDTDGCPDRDNDKDGVRDEDDGCPFDAEDLDQFEDSDGCDEPDNDKDGILDARDSCPDKPEDRDGFEDQDGCPEEGGGKVKLACGKIELDDSVYFDSGKDTIQQRSFLILDQLSSVLSEAKHILKVRVRGHTDDTGDAKRNLDLSQRRAASVVRYLVVHGVEAARLSSEGYGESEPIADNKTPAGRARNRRVELQIVEQSGECR